MGKARKGGSSKKGTVTKMTSGKDPDDDRRSSLIDPTGRDFLYDEIDDFEERRDRIFLQQAEDLMRRRKAPREQVLGIDGSSSEDDDDDDDDDEDAGDEDNNNAHGEGSENSDPDELYMEDDIVDEPKFKLPDERAWGKKKHRYFGTDTTDEKIQWNIYNQDEEMAQLEEETARKLQERMAAELKDLVSDDLILQTDEKYKSKDVTEDFVEADVSTFSKSRKLQLLKTESPEFMPLVEDLKSKCEELRHILSPLMEGIKLGKIPEGPVHHYITTKYRLVLNYVCTINMYMMIKCDSKSVRTHPVVGRLAQYRQLLQELEECDNQLALHLGKLLNDISNAKETVLEAQTKIGKENPRKRKKELQIIRKNKAAKVEEEKKKLMALLKDPVEPKETGDKIKNKEAFNNVMEASSEEEPDAHGEDYKRKELGADEKRPIGYGIQKNKGLMPYRKKDQRNPRVRYKKKFSKKVKRRKGQVKEVRKEMDRYGGEVTGIKSHTVKSIKIKS